MEITWFLLGAVIVGGFVLLLNWMRSNNRSFTWYEWLLGVIGLALLVFAVQSFYGSMVEDESQAAWMFLLIFGVPAIIVFAITWRLAARRQQSG